MFDITNIVEIIGALLAAIITGLVIPFIKSKTTENQQQTINEWVKIAVTAAEQIYKGSGRGREKKEYVIEFLEKRGIALDYDAVDTMIESAVLALNKGLM